MFSWFVICRCPDNLSPLILIYMARIIVLRLISDFIVFIKRSLAEILVNIFQCANCALLGSPLLGSNVTMDQLSVPQPVFTITEKAPHSHLRHY